MVSSVPWKNRIVGYGLALIACEREGRKCFAMDIDPTYVDMAVLRWEQFSGKSAILDSTGQTFAEVRESRLGATKAEVVAA